MRTTTFKLDEATDTNLNKLAENYLGYKTSRTNILKFLVKQAITKNEE